MKLQYHNKTLTGFVSVMYSKEEQNMVNENIAVLTG